MDGNECVLWHGSRAVARPGSCCLCEKQGRKKDSQCVHALFWCEHCVFRIQAKFWPAVNFFFTKPENLVLRQFQTQQEEERRISEICCSAYIFPKGMLDVDHDITGDSYVCLAGLENWDNECSRKDASGGDMVM